MFFVFLFTADAEITGANSFRILSDFVVSLVPTCTKVLIYEHFFLCWSG